MRFCISKVLASALAYVVWVPAAFGAVTYDTTSSLDVNGTSSPYTWSHTVAAGSNLLLICQTALGASVDVTAISYNSVALTFLSTAANSGRTVEVWYLKNPSTGTNTVSVTASGTGNGYASCTSYSGVDQTSPLGTPVTNSGVAASTSVSITVPSGGQGYDAGAHSGDSCPAGATATGDQTDRVSSCNTGNGAGGFAGTTSTSGSRTHSWSFSSAGTNFGQVGVAINPVASTAVSQTLMLLGVGN